jgi:hypothetical protein
MKSENICTSVRAARLTTRGWDDTFAIPDYTLLRDMSTFTYNRLFDFLRDILSTARLAESSLFTGVPLPISSQLVDLRMWTTND